MDRPRSALSASASASGLWDRGEGGFPTLMVGRALIRAMYFSLCTCHLIMKDCL